MDVNVRMLRLHGPVLCVRGALRVQVPACATPVALIRIIRYTPREAGERCPERLVVVCWDYAPLLYSQRGLSKGLSRGVIPSPLGIPEGIAPVQQSMS